MSTTNNATSIFANPLSSTSDSFPKRQRIRVEDSAENLARTIRSAFRGLNELWNRVHMDMPTREHRAQQASKYVHDLLRDIRSSEEKVREKEVQNFYFIGC
uniref:Syntaxin-6_N domain-containing protein n=1 Tax=Globodera pallida TaxID=36090 RepID=A0A183C421_GLOPA